MVMNTGKEVVKSENNLLSTIAWKIGDSVTYALEGSVFVGGAAIQWLRDGIQLINNASESESLATSVPDNGGVYFVPALTGMGAPYWDQYARGAILGITRGTTAAHITRATLEGIAFQVYDILKAMEHDTQRQSLELRVDGGAVANNFLMQFQSDICRTNVIRPQILETTALGAAYLAGLATGFWRDTEELRKQWNANKEFSPVATEEEVDKQLHMWHKAVERARNWEELA